MPTYVYLYENTGNIHETDANRQLNNILTILQEKNGKILDVKLSTISGGVGLTRSFLVIYQAEKKIQIST